MSKIIVDVSSGFVEGVYTDHPGIVDYVVADEDDEEKKGEYAAMQYLMARQTVRPIDCEKIEFLPAPPQFNDCANDLILNKDDLPDEELAVKKAQAVFIDGYCAAHSELVKYLFELQDENVPGAAEAFALMETLVDMQKDNLLALCGQLNDEEVD